MKRLGIEQFLGYLIEHITKHTGIKCYDFPNNVPSPLYSVDIESTEQERTKTMYLEIYNIDIHCISAKSNPYSNAPVLKLVGRLEEALSTDVVLPDPYQIYLQDYKGLLTVKRDESGEGHAVVSYQFSVCSGYICK